MPDRRLYEGDILSLSERSRDARHGAITVVRRMRKRGESLTAAAETVGVARKSVLKYAGRALEKDESGEWEAKPWDRIIRLVKFPSPKGPKTLAVRDSRSADKVARYWDAVRDYLDTGDEDLLDPFRGESVQVRGERHEFVTDPDILKRQARAGVVTFEHLYESTT